MARFLAWRFAAGLAGGVLMVLAAWLRALNVQYALNALGLVPHMIFLVDYVVRGLGQGFDAGAEYWVLFGLGAVVGPLVSGHLADRTGFGPALRLGFLIQAVAVALPLLGRGTPGLIVPRLRSHFTRLAAYVV